MLKITLRPGKEEFVRRFHPWIFSGAIAKMEGDAHDGAIAQVFDRQGNTLGFGHYHHHGSIAVRMLTFGNEDLESLDFWVNKFENAFAVRKTLGLIGDLDTNCFRLAHGEGDGLSGLVVDVYGESIVLQCHSIGMHKQRELIAAAAKNVLGKHMAVYDKSKESLPEKYAQTVENQFIGKPGEPEVSVFENGLKFKIDLVAGQKTGFFLDQRDNRLLLTKFARGKSVLNTFCYTGGFSIYALAAGAAEVHSVDVSEKAMKLTDENVAQNAPFDGQHFSHCLDVQRFMKNSDRQFEVVVVDPPAFAKTMDKRHNAVIGYKNLNVEAIKRVSPGGVMFTFSCSQVVDRELFYNTIVAAAMESGRQVRVLHHLTQGGDHPVNIFHPEGAYLKGLVLFVA